MTELERLRADLATLEAAQETINQIGKNRYTSSYWVEFAIVTDLKKRIADIEAQQELIDPWQTAKKALAQWESADSLLNSKEKRAILAYVRNLKAKVDDLNHELRCERIDGGKVRDDRKAISAEKSREKLAELTTILNAIPPVCRIFFYSEQSRETLDLARELVERRISEVKKEMQNNG